MKRYLFNIPHELEQVQGPSTKLFLEYFQWEELFFWQYNVVTLTAVYQP